MTFHSKSQFAEGSVPCPSPTILLALLFCLFILSYLASPLPILGSKQGLKIKQYQ